MKKLIGLIILAMLFVLLIPISASATPLRGMPYPTVIQGADCNNYWQKVKLPKEYGIYPVRLLKSSGTGTWSWGSKTSASLPNVFVTWCWGLGCNTAGTNGEPLGGGTIYKDDWCDPVTGEKRSGPGGGSSRSVSLPKRQPYLLLDDGKMWCYTMTKTPILGDAEEAWCQLGTVPEGINDFCLQPNYRDLFGCTLENYNVRHPSDKQLIHYYCG